MAEHLSQQGMHTGIQTISVIFEHKASHDFWVHLSLKLHCSLSLTLYHLPHALLYSTRDSYSSGEFGTDNILLLPTKSDIGMAIN